LETPEGGWRGSPIKKALESCGKSGHGGTEKYRQNRGWVSKTIKRTVARKGEKLPSGEKTAY